MAIVEIELILHIVKVDTKLLLLNHRFHASLSALNLLTELAHGTDIFLASNHLLDHDPELLTLIFQTKIATVARITPIVYQGR